MPTQSKATPVSAASDIDDLSKLSILEQVQAKKEADMKAAAEAEARAAAEKVEAEKVAKEEAEAAEKAEVEKAAKEEAEAAEKAMALAEAKALEEAEAKKIKAAEAKAADRAEKAKAAAEARAAEEKAKSAEAKVTKAKASAKKTAKKSTAKATTKKTSTAKKASTAAKKTRKTKARASTTKAAAVKTAESITVPTETQMPIAAALSMPTEKISEELEANIVGSETKAPVSEMPSLEVSTLEVPTSKPPLAERPTSESATNPANSTNPASSTNASSPTNYSSKAMPNHTSASTSIKPLEKGVSFVAADRIGEDIWVPSANIPTIDEATYKTQKAQAEAQRRAIEVASLNLKNINDLHRLEQQSIEVAISTKQNETYAAQLTSADIDYQTQLERNGEKSEHLRQAAVKREAATRETGYTEQLVSLKEQNFELDVQQAQNVFAEKAARYRAQLSGS